MWILQYFLCIVATVAVLYVPICPVSPLQKPKLIQHAQHNVGEWVKSWLEPMAEATMTAIDKLMTSTVAQIA